MQPLGEASGEEKPTYLGEIAEEYLDRPDPDKTYGIYKKECIYYIGNKQATIADNNIMIDDEIFKGTSGPWELLLSKRPNDNIYTRKDYDNYAKLMLKTNALHRDNDPKSLYPKSSKSEKWVSLLSPIWHESKEYQEGIARAYLTEGYEGEGVIVMSGDPNALLKRLDLLLSSQEAGHTGVRNELVSICDELKRQGVLDTKAYKKLNSIIIK